jgi:hypothetical protein
MIMKKFERGLVDIHFLYCYLILDISCSVIGQIVTECLLYLRHFAKT